MLTNSTATFSDGTAIVSGRDKNQVAGLELKETMILCGRAAQTTHIKSIAVFCQPMEQIVESSGKFNLVTTEAGVRVELPEGQDDHDAARDDSLGVGGDMQES